MKQRVWTLCIASVVCLLIVAGIHTSSAQDRITAAKAIEAATKAVNSSSVGEWKIAFISTFGVTKTFLDPEYKNKNDALMFPDGTAGQWLIEFFRDTPKSVTQEGKQGMGYPFQRVLVTPKKWVNEDEFQLIIEGKGKLFALKPEYIAALDTARKLAISKIKTKYDLISVGSGVEEHGETSWRFRFYDTKKDELVDKISISADGKKRLAWE